VLIELMPRAAAWLFKNFPFFFKKRWELRPEADRRLVKRVFEEILPVDRAIGLFDALGYTWCFLAQARLIDDYLEFIARPDSFFFDRRVEVAKQEFNMALKKLRKFMVQYFFTSHINPNRIELTAPAPPDAADYYSRVAGGLLTPRNEESLACS